MWESIAKTAERIDRAWSRADRAREAFPDLAHREVEALLGSGEFGVDQILASLASRVDWSEQLDPHTNFGEPAITVYKTERWNLDVYFWLHPRTALHDHRFCGAFGVADGLTLNSTYDFSAREPSPQGIEIGRLERRESELLRPGAVRRILPGRGFIHQVVHVARPTVSIALRTVREPDLPCQREYFWPGFSVPSLQYLSPPQRRKYELVGTLVSIRHARAEELVARMLDGEDDACAFWILYRLFQAAGRRLDAVARVLDRTSAPIARFREELSHCLSSVGESSLYWTLARKEPHRLLAALTASLQDADEITRLVEEYSGGVAAETVILEWLAEMKREEEAAGRLASLEKRAGPLARLDLGPRTACVLRGILAAEDRAEILRRALSEFPEEPPDALEREIDALGERIARTPLLAPFGIRWQNRGRS